MATKRAKLADPRELFIGNLNTILIGSEIIRVDGSDEYATHLEQHLQGIRRMGVLLYNQYGETKLSVIRFARQRAGLTTSPLADACRAQTFLTEWSGERLAQRGSLVTSTKATFGGISSNNFSGPSIKTESYDLVLFFERQKPMFRVWSVLEAMLIGLSLNQCAQIMHPPEIVRAPDISDFYPLPLYPGKPDELLGELRGGLNEERTQSVVFTQSTPARISSNIVSGYERVPVAKFNELEAFLADYMDDAYRAAKREVDVLTAPATEMSDSQAPPIDNEAVDTQICPVLAGDLERTSADSWSRRRAKPDYLSMIEADPARDEVRTRVERWKQMPWSIVETELHAWVRSPFLVLYASDAPFWIAYMVDELSLNRSHFVEKLRLRVMTMDISTISLKCLIDLCSAFEFKMHEIGRMVVRWLGANGGHFIIEETDRCVMEYRGGKYAVVNGHPFRTLLWELLRSGTGGILLDDIWYGVDCEAYSRAGYSGQPVREVPTTVEEILACHKAEQEEKDRWIFKST